MNRRRHPIYELMARVVIMQEPISAAIAAIAELVDISSESVRLIIGICGMILLAVSFREAGKPRGSQIAAPGWVLLGLFVYLQSSYYIKIGDPVLVLMTAAALPGGIILAVWELRNQTENHSLIWFRGMVAWSVIPYHIVYLIPYLNIAFVLFTAHSAEWMLEFAGLGSYSVGEMFVSLEGGGEVPLADWEGNMWLLTQPLGESGFFVPMYHSDGEVANISFILSCSGLQSMIIFVGAICALRSVPWNRRLRGLIIAVPTIHVLNTFRNAGIVWLTDAYPNWTISGIGMFDFAHSYAAKAASLFAMFLMAIALFDLLPELHKHIVKLLPINLEKESESA
ncbi:MAG TPA: archaeosortase A [Candidatus Poseidoniales archaeon]|nr:MAG TPA: archaeosortase A [Candidatus Poseidoniales archaeon]